MRRLAFLVSLFAATGLPRLASADINDNAYPAQNSTAKNITLGTLLGVAVASWTGFIVWQLKAAGVRHDRETMGDGLTVCARSEVDCARYERLFWDERGAMDSGKPFFYVALPASLSLLVVQFAWPNDGPKLSVAPSFSHVSSGIQIQARF